MLLTPYPWSPGAIDRDDGLALIASAERLKLAAASAEGLPPLLRGKRLALLSDDPDTPAGQAFVQAATALGGHVTQLRASGLGERGTAALLGQLYDAIECQGVPEHDMRRLGRDAGVPVFDSVGRPGHPLYRLADAQDAAARQRLLQALLMATLG